MGDLKARGSLVAHRDRPGGWCMRKIGFKRGKSWEVVLGIAGGGWHPIDSPEVILTWGPVLLPAQCRPSWGTVSPLNHSVNTSGASVMLRQVWQTVAPGPLLATGITLYIV